MRIAWHIFLLIVFYFPSFLFCFSKPHFSGSHNREISDTVRVETFAVIHQILLVGNRVTKDHIIIRELPFKKNDTINKSELPQLFKSAKENILNTSLFNFVTIDTLPQGSNHLSILITVSERWYTWPAPIFEVQEQNFNTWWKTRNFERANYGFYLNRENFRGRKENLSFYFQFGYTEKYGLTYKIPYLTRKQVSGAGVSFSYSRNREIAYMTLDNKQLYFKNPNEYVREEFTTKLNYTYRSGIHNTHSLETKYVNAKINDTLNDYTVGYFIGQETAIQYFSLEYFYTMDYRDSKSYPLEGHFLEFEATRLGFGLLKNEKIDVINLYANIKKYHKIANRFCTSASLRLKFSPSKSEPYYVQKGLGWKDYVRAYEYYVIDGQQYGLAKLGVKYEIIKPRVQEIRNLPLQKFNRFHYALYGGFFADGGYVDDRQYAFANPLANTFMYGYGVGIDYVTYYDIVVRFEYSINKRMEHGFFLHFNAGI